MAQIHIHARLIAAHKVTGSHIRRVAEPEQRRGERFHRASFIAKPWAKTVRVGIALDDIEAAYHWPGHSRRRKRVFGVGHRVKLRHIKRTLEVEDAAEAETAFADYLRVGINPEAVEIFRDFVRVEFELITDVAD